MENISQYDIDGLGWVYKKGERHGDYLTIFYFEKEEKDEDYDAEYYLKHELRYFKPFNGDPPHIIIIREVCPSHYSQVFSKSITDIKDLEEIR